MKRLLLAVLLIIPLLSLAGDTACSCIETARLAGSPIPFPSDAEHIKSNSYPVIGGLILLYYPYSTTYHVAVIKKFLKEGFLVYEGNFKPCQKGYRIVDYNDKFITGFSRNDLIEMKDRFLALHSQSVIFNELE